MRKIVIVCALAGAALSMPGTAAAQDATGPCTASATLSNGVVVDPYNPALEGTVYEIPLEGNAEYNGSVGGANPPRAISGSVVISGPPGFGDISLNDAWEWEGPNATGDSDSGNVSWDLPALLPRGVELEVHGVHRENGAVVCEGTVLVTLAGGFFDSPLGWIALAGTVLSAAGIAGAMVAKP